VSKLSIWIKELRLPFLVVTVSAVSIGLATAWERHHVFNFLYAVLTLIGTCCLHLSVNVLNDYFDYKSGIDLKTTPTPFSGGSGILPGKLLEPVSVYRAGLLFLALGAIIGVYFTIVRGLPVLILLLIGAISVYFYSQKISSWGIGEVFVGLNFGPLMVLGTYYVQMEMVALKPLWWLQPLYVGLIPGILTAAVLYINEFPDLFADIAGGRYHIPAMLGKKRAVNGYTALMLTVYTLIILGVAVRIMPIPCLIALASLPIAVKGIRIAREHYDRIVELIPAMASTIMVNVITGFLLTVAYIIHGISPI